MVGEHTEHNPTPRELGVGDALGLLTTTEEPQGACLRPDTDPGRAPHWGLADTQVQRAHEPYLAFDVGDELEAVVADLKGVAAGRVVVAEPHAGTTVGVAELDVDEHAEIGEAVG